MIDVIVTPEDRQRMASVYAVNAPKYAKEILDGKHDATPLLLAFAHHRTDHAQDVAALSRALDYIEKRATVQPDELGDATQLAINCGKILSHVSDARRALATPKPEPVLRWKGDTLWLGDAQAGWVHRDYTGEWGWNSPFSLGSYCSTEAKARTAAEQAVRDWLKRAGVM